MIPIWIGLALALAAVPVAGAHHPSNVCRKAEILHGYSLTDRSGTASGKEDVQPGTKQGYTTVVTAWDSCLEDLDGDGIPGDYDGDMEIGNDGGRFPAGTDRNGCAEARGESPHHAHGVGARYWANDGTGIAVFAYWAGADGPALVGSEVDPCWTDGIISDDPSTDPLDCANGSWGLHAGSVLTPATLDENTPGSGACDPWDSLVWVFLVTASYVNAGSVIISTPIYGHIWSD